MHKIFKGLTVFVAMAGLLSLTNPTFTNAQSNTERVDAFHSDIIIEKDSSIRVTETILYNFGTQDRHGIYRNIPFKTKNVNDGKTYLADLKVQNVTDLNGKKYIYEVSKSEGDVVIKIGDPNSTVTGKHAYVITYTYKGAIETFENKDELYWNVTGNQWNVPIQSVTAKITPSDELISSGFNLEETTCYTGVRGSQAKDCIFSRDGNSISVKSNRAFQPYEGLTFAVNFPNGILSLYQMNEDFTWWWIRLLLIYLAIVNALGLIAIPVIWKKSRPKFENFDSVIVRMYDPPKDSVGAEISPMEVGALMDGSVDPKDISAQIISLAIRKYVIIEEVKKSNIFTKNKIFFKRGKAFNTDPELKNISQHERDLLKIIKLTQQESVELSELSTIYNKIALLKNNVQKDLIEKGLFDSRRSTRILKYTGFAVLSLLAGSLTMFIGLLIIGMLTTWLTQKGFDAHRHSKGLYEFISSQDRQLEFQEKNYYFFEKLLPYAITFGVATIWAEKFKDLHDINPDWYVGDSHNFTNVGMLVGSLNSNLNSIQTNYTPSSSGSSGFSGGSSGGGGGGGGGGSW